MKKKLIVCTGLLAAATAGFGAIRAVTPDMYGGKTNAWQLARHREKMSVVTNGGAKVVFIGDSITHFWETNGKVQWEKYFAEGDLKALDLGISADRTEHVLWRLTEGGELDGYAAKAIFLMIGTNNTGHFPVEEETPIDTILGIREILKVIRAKQPSAKVVLTAIFPRGETVKDPRRRRNQVVNKEIAKFADGKNVFWLDFNEQFLTADGRLPLEVFPDLLHPGPCGYEIWASAVIPYAQAAVAGLPMPPSRYAPFVRAGDRNVSGRPSTYPVARIDERAWWPERLLEKRNEIAASGGAFDIVFFGDSITHNWERKDRGAASLAELRKTYSILNIGYSGDRTEHLLWRGENGELDGYKAKCIMLMIGTNNGKDSAEGVAAGIKEILALIARKQPQATTLLLPIFPRGNSPTCAVRVKHAKVNETIRGYADGKKVVWVDFGEKFLDAKGDTLWVMPDRLHPNEAGYRDIWLPSVLPYFKQIVGK